MKDPMIHLCYEYSVQLRGCNAWGKDIMDLIRFKHIYSAFHHVTGNYFCGEKFRQIHYLMCMFNDKAKIIFVLGEHFGFYEWEIQMRGRYYPVSMHKKDKPEKYIVTFSSWLIPNIILSSMLMCTKGKYIKHFHPLSTT